MTGRPKAETSASSSPVQTLASPSRAADAVDGESRATPAVAAWETACKWVRRDRVVRGSEQGVCAQCGADVAFLRITVQGPGSRRRQTVRYVAMIVLEVLEEGASFEAKSVADRTARPSRIR